MREEDRQVIQAQETFFEQLDNFKIEYQVAIDAQDVYQKIDDLLNAKTDDLQAAYQNKTISVWESSYQEVSNRQDWYVVF